MTNKFLFLKLSVLELEVGDVGEKIVVFEFDLVVDASDFGEFGDKSCFFLNFWFG